MSKGSRSIAPLFVAILVFFLDVPVGSASVMGGSDLEIIEEFVEPDSILPPLICDGVICPEKEPSPNFSPIDSRPAVMEHGWWDNFWSDEDSNGFDDRLQLIVSGERESVSKTTIMGEDGRFTVAIIVHYSWHPGNSDINALRSVISAHGWDAEGSWFMVMDHLDSIVLDHVPVSSLIEIWQLDGVVLVEAKRNRPLPRQSNKGF